MNIAQAVKHDLDQLPPEARDSTMAALAMSIAKRLDSGGVGVRDLASVCRELRLLMQQLLELKIPDEDEGDRLLAELRGPVPGI